MRDFFPFLSLFLQRDKDLADKFHVREASFYHYLNQSGCTTLEGVDDAVKFDNLRLAFEVVQIPSDMIDDIFSVMAAILWLGNLSFQVSGLVFYPLSHSPFTFFGFH